MIRRDVFHILDITARISFYANFPAYAKRLQNAIFCPLTLPPPMRDLRQMWINPNQGRKILGAEAFAFLGFQEYLDKNIIYSVIICNYVKCFC